MIYILYGKDTYRSRQKLRDIADRFCAVAGSKEGIVRVALQERPRSDVEAAVTTGSLFRKKRLVVLEEPSGAPADTLQYLESKFSALAASDDVFVVWDRESKSGGETFMAAAALHAAKVQEFAPLAGERAARFLEDEARARGVSLSAADKRQLLADFSGDSWQLVQKMEQKSLAGVASLSVAGRAAPEGSGRDSRLLFSFVDAYGLRQRANAWRIYHMLLQSGVEPEKIFWTLLSHVKTVIRIGSLVGSGVRAAELPRAAGVHPFVAKKAAVTAGRFSEQDLASLHTRLVDMDFETKRGRGDIALGLEKMLLAL